MTHFNLVDGDDIAVDRSRGVGNVEVFFLESVEEFQLAGNFAIQNFCVRSLDHAELVHSRMRSQAQNKADVRAFGSLDGAKTAVVGRMYVAYFVAGAGAVETAGAERRDGAQVFDFFQSVRLLHELRELVSGKEFLHSRLQGLRGNEIDRQCYVGVDGGHPVLYISFDLSHADANLLLKKLAHETDAARS